MGEVRYRKPTLQAAITEAKKIAKELCYPFDVIDSLDKAKSDMEISRIMAKARTREDY